MVLRQNSLNCIYIGLIVVRNQTEQNIGNESPFLEWGGDFFDICKCDS
jgi:hypothetical protein